MPRVIEHSDAVRLGAVLSDVPVRRVWLLAHNKVALLVAPCRLVGVDGDDMARGGTNPTLMRTKTSNQLTFYDSLLLFTTFILTFSHFNLAFCAPFQNFSDFCDIL